MKSVPAHLVIMSTAVTPPSVRDGGGEVGLHSHSKYSQLCSQRGKLPFKILLYMYTKYIGFGIKYPAVMGEANRDPSSTVSKNKVCVIPGTTMTLSSPTTFVTFKLKTLEFI